MARQIARGISWVMAFWGGGLIFLQVRDYYVRGQLCDTGFGGWGCSLLPILWVITAGLFVFGILGVLYFFRGK